MKNETISRIVLILEIGAIILFHSLKSAPPVNHHHVVQGIKESKPVHIQQVSSPFVYTQLK
jgi:hypothetical protein